MSGANLLFALNVVGLILMGVFLMVYFLISKTTSKKWVAVGVLLSFLLAAVYVVLATQGGSMLQWLEAASWSVLTLALLGALKRKPA